MIQLCYHQITFSKFIILVTELHFAKGIIYMKSIIGVFKYSLLILFEISALPAFIFWKHFNLVSLSVALDVLLWQILIAFRNDIATPFLFCRFSLLSLFLFFFLAYTPPFIFFSGQNKLICRIAIAYQVNVQ